MKSNIKALSTHLLFLLIAYLILAFINASLNVIEWGVFSRFVFSVCGVVTILNIYDDIDL